MTKNDKNGFLMLMELMDKKCNFIKKYGIMPTHSVLGKKQISYIKEAITPKSYENDFLWRDAPKIMNGVDEIYGLKIIKVDEDDIIGVALSQ